ncbi:hypothetical protein CA54_48430 [Symmachiella macrocystis]|uniref:Signal peptidase I n=1 Tax=Symmachiella macrocystis TaxID=2527985 RepID=A0A5C6BDQ7_9PLAN|nr:DUF5684 domain-containing protein [Symmachiella macrocystis]TWU09601.1 hypothetical protein CA54_48430 [Symmachiella macrocystis]
MADFGQALLAQSEGSSGGLLGLVPVFVMLAIGVAVIAGFWKAFEKAGEPGWAVLVPIYNAIVFLKIAGKPAWWFILLLIPLVGMVVAIIAAIDFAKAYGKGTGYGVGIAFLGAIFVPMLGFGDARFQGAAA